MASLDEKALAENCVIRSGNEFLCFLCAHRGDASTNWRSHMDDARHAGALRQFRTFFASTNGTQLINCKACNSSVDHEAFVDHATWHRIVPWHEIADKHKIFFENRILRVSSTSSYACLPCKLKFADWSRALLHVGEESHLEAVSFEPPVHEGFEPCSTTYEFLVAEGFEPWAAKSVKCHHCNRPNVQLTSVQEHAADTWHEEAKKTFPVRFETAEPSFGQHEATEPPSSHYRAAEQPSSHHRAAEQPSSHHRAAEQPSSHNRAFAGSASNNKTNDSRNGNARSRPRDPVTTKVRHSSVPQRDPPHRPTFKAKKWQPRRSGSGTSDYPRSFPVERRDSGLYCSVCEVQVHTEAEVHTKEESHLKTLEALGHGEIEPVDGWTYKCKCCNCKVPNLENVFRHIKGMKHRQIFTSSKCEKPQPRGNTISFKMNFPATNNGPNSARFPLHSLLDHSAAPFNFPARPMLNVTPQLPLKYPTPPLVPLVKYPPPLLSAPLFQAASSTQNVLGLVTLTKSAWENFPRDYIVVQNSKDLFCRICDCVIYGHGNVDEHIKSKGHGEAVNDFCSNVLVRPDNSYHCKKCKIDVPSRNDLYIHSIGHAAKNRNETVVYGKEETSSQEGETSSPRAETSSPNGETDKVAPRSGNEHIVVLNRQDYCCKVCYTLLLHEETKIEEHLASEKHGEALTRHAKTGYKEDGKYSCGHCRCTIPNFANVPCHAMSERHKRALPGGGATTGASLPSDWRELSRYYIAASGDDSYYCRICNVAVFSRPEVANHLADEQHFRNLDKYGCSEISEINGKQFNCTYCQCVIPDLGNVYVHLSGERHLDNLKNARRKMSAKQPETVPEEYEKRSQMEAQNSREPEAKLRDKDEEAKKTADQSSSEDYERMIEMMMKSDAKEPKDNNTPERTVTTNRDVSGLFNVNSLASSTLSINEAGLRKQRTPKIVKDTKTVAILDEDLARVYDTSERARHAEKSQKLLLVDDFHSFYCIACKQRIGSLPADRLEEHLWSAEHCSNFEIMLEGEAKFADTPEQFSDLKLAHDYLEEIILPDDELIKCHVCEIELENVETEIRDHIAEKTHGKKREAQRAKVLNALADIKTQPEPDWYNVHRYKCVPCSGIFDSEIRFAQHLKSPEHKKEANLEARPGRPLFNDHCPACSLLWYGYLTTHDDHRRTEEHLRHSILDNETTVAKLPTAAKHYLLLHDRSVDRYEKLFEESNAKRTASEANVISDLEYCCGPESKAIEVWAFQIMPESSDQKEIVEYEVYFDLEKLSDREDVPEKTVSCVMSHVETCLLQEPALWRKDEIPADEGSSSSGRLTMSHLPSGTRCIMLFDARSDLTVEKLYQFAMLKFPIVTKLMGFLRPWLRISELLGPQRFTLIDLFCYVILYLQSESLFPKICDLTDLNGGLHLKPDADMTVLELETSLVASQRDLRQLSAGFFRYYAHFDYRRDVACPRIGCTIGKREYTANYTDAKLSQFHSAVCIENPLNKENNLAACVDKLHAKHFREYCAESHLILEKISNTS